MQKIKLGIVDDQKIFRESLCSLLQSFPEVELILEAEHGAHCLQLLEVANVFPDILLIDMEMPVMNGLELNEALQKKHPHIKRIVLSVVAKERIIAKLIEAGASAYLIKNCGKEELRTSILSVYQNGFHMNADMMKAIQSKSLGNPNKNNQHHYSVELSPREKEVLQLICKEYSNQEIAEQLFLSIRTIEGHRNNLLLKTGCKNTAGLVLFAVKNHIIELIY